jgi:hypothetical protein
MNLWRRQPKPAYRAAAAAILAEPVGATTVPNAATRPEIESMRALAGILADLPPEAWPEAATTTLTRRPRPTRSSGARRPLTTALAAACLALGFLAGTLTHTHNTTQPHGPGIALRPLAPASKTERVVAYMTAPGQMQLRILRLSPSPPGTYYELWLMTTPTHLSPVAAFRIDQSGQATLDLRLPDDPAHYTYLDISRQQIGAGTRISGDSVLRGNLS